MLHITPCGRYGYTTKSTEHLKQHTCLCDSLPDRLRTTTTLNGINDHSVNVTAVRGLTFSDLTFHSLHGRVPLPALLINTHHFRQSHQLFHLGLRAENSISFRIFFFFSLPLSFSPLLSGPPPSLTEIRS